MELIFLYKVKKIIYEWSQNRSFIIIIIFFFFWYFDILKFITDYQGG